MARAGRLSKKKRKATRPGSRPSGDSNSFVHTLRSHRILPDQKSSAFKALKFVALFLILFIPAAYVLSASYPLKMLAARSAATVLSALGRPATAIDSQPNTSVISSNVTAEIIDYCSGGLEIAVLLGIIFASTDRSLRDRLAGFLAGSLIALAFNAIRIAATIFVYSDSAPFISAVFHDLLFRASIVIFVATYYALWYYSTGEV
jgi:exosortase/archaeosortase family protein